MATRHARKVEEFFEKYRLRHIDKNQTLIYAGDEPPGIFHLISGQVRQYDITEQGEEVVIDVLTPPVFFPMTWAIIKKPSQYFYETSVPTDVRMAPVDDVIAFLKASPDVTYNLLSSLYSETNDMQRRIAHLMGGNGRSRVIFELFVECERFGKLQTDGSFILSLHENELARRAGLSRETINRELSKLKKMKVIDITHKEIIIKNLKQLEKELGSGL